MYEQRLFLRSEIFVNEYRTPLVPTDVSFLTLNGWRVYVQSSNIRCYTDDEYRDAGAIIVDTDWTCYTDCLILGIKELDQIENMKESVHVYFAHCYKKQTNSQYILNKFKQSKSVLYDIEYLVDDNNKRLISFSLHAGKSGCILGLLQYQMRKQYKQPLRNLQPWTSEKNALEKLTYDFTNTSICIIGSNGRCGQGVRSILDQYNIKYVCYNSKDKISELVDFDIIFNCIHLQKNIPPFLSKHSPIYKYTLVIDISCDYNSPYNPLPIYDNKTTWKKPVYSSNGILDVIAIDNLPSLLPYDSSLYFSSILRNLLIDDTGEIWDRARTHFNTHINSVE